MIYWLLERLFQLKRNYYDKAIWFCISISILSLASVLKKADWIVFFSNLSSKYSEKPYLEIFIQFFGLILTGGSWILSIISGCFAVFLLIVKSKVSSGSISGEKFYQHEFDYYQREIEKFNFQSAFRKLRDIEHHISLASLARISKPLVARLNFLLGESSTYIEDNEQHNKWKYYVKAFELQRHSLLYKERYCITMYHQKEHDRALTIAQEILEETDLSGRAWAIKLLNQENLAIDDIPKHIRKDQDFLRILGFHLLKRASTEVLDELLKDVLNDLKSPSSIQIKYSNLGYYHFISGYTFEKVLSRSKMPLFDPTPIDSTELHISRKIFEKTVTAMASSDSKGTEIYLKSLFFGKLTTYLIEPDLNIARELSVLYKANLEKLGNPVVFKNVVAALTQNGLYEEVVILCNVVSENDRHFFLGIAKYHLNKVNEAEISWIDYFSAIDKIDEFNIEYLLFIFSLLHSVRVDTKSMFENHLSKKPYQSYKERLVLSSFANLFELNEEQIKELKGQEKDVLTNPNVTKAYLEILFHNRRYDDVVNFISDHLDSLSLEPGILVLKTRSLSALGKKLEEAKEGFKALRKIRVTPDIIREELNLAIKTEDFETIKEVSKVGLDNFKLDIFRYYHAFALDKLDDVEGIDVIASDEILCIDLDFQRIIDIASLLIRHDHFGLGLELAYKTVMSDYANPVLKESYFGLCQLLQSKGGHLEFDGNLPEQLQNGYWALLRTQSNKTIVIGEKDPLYEALIGKGVGEKVSNSDLFNSRVYILDSIVSKYKGLYTKIYDEIDSADPDGSQFKARVFKYSTIEDFQKQMVDQFGQSEEHKRIHADESFKKYFLSQISFSELVLNTRPNQPLVIYKILTSAIAEWNNGFYVLPNKFLKPVNWSEIETICLDITTVPLFYDLYKDTPDILASKNVVVSYYLLEYLKTSLKELKIFGKSEGRLHINLAGIHVEREPEGSWEVQVEYLSNLVEFVENHLNPQISMKKFEGVSNDSQWFQSEWYLKYLTDTIFLSMDGILISDDRVFLKWKDIPFTSSEAYLKSTVSSTEAYDKILLRLIEKQYNGVFLNSRVMFQIYMLPSMSNWQLNHIIKNLPHKMNHNTQILDEVLDFLRDIYAQGGDKPIIRRISQTFLRSVLIDYPNPLRLKNTIQSKITSRFNLLGMSIIEIMEDFTIAFDILEKERNPKR